MNMDHRFYCNWFFNMKVLIFTTLLVCLLASPLDKYNALVRQDDCAAKTLDLIKPEIDAKLEELKNVIFLSFRTETSSSKLKFLLLWKRENKCSTSASHPSLPPRSVMLLNGKVLPSFWPPTASRMSESNSSSLTQSSNHPRTGPTTSLLASSDTSSADKPPRTAANSSTSSSDLNKLLIPYSYLFKNTSDFSLPELNLHGDFLLEFLKKQ